MLRPGDPVRGMSEGGRNLLILRAGNAARSILSDAQALAPA